ncbi:MULTISPECIES: hypothetical protein [unclassified Rhodococcus (in: high G+C Gram-positive bacteria)]|uniref:hypothetical protein n=1 Tax=unclassified Rhodococcus (in: high G+C Gram-positive bacteria) TaxID=192944 RepID=UPI001ED8FC23|nr:hypothetical protein [Rhodococcus sp. DK17]
MTDAATTPPLGKILTADETARLVARVAYPTSPLVNEELALPAPVRAYGYRRVPSACRTWQRRRARFCPRQPTAAPRPTRITDSGPGA